MAPADSSYQVLADRIEGQITSARPGTRLASEHELGSTFGVSRITARAALQELERRHVVRRLRGSGTFVALRIPYPLRTDTPPSWSQVVREAGHEPSYDIREVGSTRASADQADALRVPRGTRLTRIDRVARIDGVVAAHQISWLPSSRIPRLRHHLGPGDSLTTVLQERYGFDSRRLWAQAELSTTPAPIAQALELTSRRPAWRIRTLNRAADPSWASRQGPGEPVPIEYADSWMRADCFQVRIEVGPADGPTSP
jgi:DNA-binding GntR family transcriptional regulator